MSHNISYTIAERDKAKVITLAGAISSTSNEQLFLLLDNITTKYSVIINMDGVTFVSTSGIATLLEASLIAKERKKRIVFCRPPESALQLIRIMDVFEQFIIVDSIDKGLIKIKYYT